MTTAKTSNGQWRNLTAEEVKASFGDNGAKAFAALMAANKVAGDARKALHAIVSVTLGAAPAGKVIVTKAQFGKLSIGIVDGEAKSDTAKPSLADWLKAQATA